MKFLLASLSLSSIASQVLGVGAEPVALEQQARALACPPLAVDIVYEIISDLHASPFCTSWLGITTVTETASTTSTPVVSVSTSTTSTSVTLETTTESTTTTTSTTTTDVVPAPTSTSVVDNSVTITLTTSTETIVVTQDASTSTTASAYGYRRKARRGPTPPKPAKLPNLIAFADNLVSSACSCYVTTPTVTTTTTLFTTSTTVSTIVIPTLQTSYVSTETDVSVATVIITSFSSTTPLTVVTSTMTSTVNELATTTTTTVIPTTTVVDIPVQVVQVDPFDGCTVTGGAIYTMSNYAATSFIDALNQCLPHCLAIGISGPGCVAVTIYQPTAGALYTCYVQDQYQSYSNNFQCNNYGSPPPYNTQYLLY